MDRRRFLGRGVGVHGGHQTFAQAETCIQNGFDQWGQAVGGAAGVGDDFVLGRVVLFVVHTHDHGLDVAFAWGRDDDALGASGDVLGSQSS